MSIEFMINKNQYRPSINKVHDMTTAEKAISEFAVLWELNKGGAEHFISINLHSEFSSIDNNAIKQCRKSSIFKQ